MKKYFPLFLVVLCLSCYSCHSYDYDLKLMGEAVQQHLRYRDTDNGTKTKVEYLKALSYEKIPEDQRSKPDEVYLCKVYVKGTWAYYDSYRVFNINDTLNCYFNKDKRFVRLDNLKEQ